MKKDLPKNKKIIIQEVHNGTDVKRYINGKQDIEQEIMEMFENDIDPEDIYDINGKASYRLKDLISHIITLVQKDTNDSWLNQKANEHDNRIRKACREEMVEKIDEMIAKTDDYKEKSGLYEARDVINLIKQNDN